MSTVKSARTFESNFPPQLSDVPFIMNMKARPTLRVATLVASLLAIAACGGGGTNSAPSESSIIPASSTPPTTDAPSLLAELPAAREVWRQMNSSQSQTIIDGGVGLSTGGIFGALADPVSGKITIWIWNKTDFVAGQDFLIEDPWYETYLLENVQILDLTGDGLDDLFVVYAPNQTEGKAFSDFDGSWKQLTFDGKQSTYGGALKGATINGYEKTCLPSCADGPSIPITYVWDGTEFKGESVDSFGNRFTMTIGPTCTVFTAKKYEPFKMCDKGKGIKYFQQALDDQYLLHDSSVDGYFGPKLEYSVKSLQYSYGLPVTGIIDGQWYRDFIEAYNLNYGIGG